MAKIPFSSSPGRLTSLLPVYLHTNNPAVSISLGCAFASMPASPLSTCPPCPPPSHTQCLTACRLLTRTGTTWKLRQYTTQLVEMVEAQHPAILGGAVATCPSC